jgi:5-methylcytosine-specific restriction enzyme subunit McrC
MGAIPLVGPWNSFTIHQTILGATLHIIPCQFHKFSQDTLINRTLKYCSTLMLRQTRNYKTASLLRQILMILEPVEYTPVTLHEVRHIQITRLNRRYAPFITFCEFYLSHTTIALQASSTEIFSLVIPMEKIFESFIALSLWIYNVFSLAQFT